MKNVWSIVKRIIKNDPKTSAIGLSQISGAIALIGSMATGIIPIDMTSISTVILGLSSGVGNLLAKDGDKP